MTHPPQEYFGNIIPRVVSLLYDTVPHTYRRAAAFSISRLLTTVHPRHQPLASAMVLSIFQSPFLSMSEKSTSKLSEVITVSQPSASDPLLDLTPTMALSALLALVTNTDPSPTFISQLLSPIVPALSALLCHIESIKTSDPALKEDLNGLLITWGRLVSAQDGTSVLWSIIEGEGGEWATMPGEQLRRVKRYVK